MMLAARDPAAKITVYERGRFYSCGTCGLPHYLEEDLQALKDAVCGKEEELAANGIEAHLCHEVTEIRPQEHTLTVRDLQGQKESRVSYDRLVLATGNRAQIPDVPGADRVGVQTLKSVENLLFLKEYIRTPYVRDIVILGGSYEGLEIAKSFMRLGRNVRVIEKEKRLLKEFDPEVASMIQKELEEEGLVFQLGETVREFPGQTFIEQVRTDRGNYPCDLCISAISARPEAQLAASAGITLEADGSIRVNEKLETGVPDIYAVGSCTRGPGSLGRTSSLHAGGLEIARTGLTQEEAAKVGIRVTCAIASGNDRPGICPGPNKVTIKLVCSAADGRILGAQAWGRKNAAARINAIAVAIAAGMTAGQLGQVGFVYSSCASSIWDPVQIVCSKMESGARFHA